MPRVAPRFYLPLRRLFWIRFALLVSILYVAWFVVVLYGKGQSFGDDPDAWAVLTTRQWTTVGYGVLGAVLLWMGLVLARKDEPPARYEVADPTPPADLHTPSFLGAATPEPSTAEPPADAP